MTCIHRYSIRQGSLTSPQMPSASPAPIHLQCVYTDIFAVSKVLFFPECYIVGLILFSFLRLFSLNMHLSFLHVLLWLTAHLFLLLNNTLLYGCTTVCMFIHLLKDNMITSVFDNVSICVQVFFFFSVDIFSPHFGKYLMNTLCI